MPMCCYVLLRVLIPCPVVCGDVIIWLCAAMYCYVLLYAVMWHVARCLYGFMCCYVVLCDTVRCYVVCGAVAMYRYVLSCVIVFC